MSADSEKKWKSKFYDKEYGKGEEALEEAAKIVAVSVRCFALIVS